MAILGGGCGGIAAAFWLTSTEELRQKFEVTIYTRGWRLGGKGASGRSCDANRKIEEHGLHLWMGCYRHAFSMMKACYAESSGPYRVLHDAFSPIRQIILEEQDGSGTSPWEPWAIPFPTLSGDIGDPTRPSMADIVSRLSEWLEQFIARNPVLAKRLKGYRRALAAFRKAIASSDPGDRDKANCLLKGVNIQTVPPLTPVSAAQTGRTHTLGPRQAVERAWILVNLGTAMLIGFLNCVAPTPDDDYQAGFDRLNDQEFRDWLSEHGAVYEALGAAPVRAIYDLAFGYKNGLPWKISNGSMATGVTLRLVLEIAGGYCDAPFWRMESGMGDTIFTPLYQVLHNRKVTIKFFHRVEDLVPDAKQERIVAVKMARQAELAVTEYDPFLTVGKDKRKCWPSKPLWDQIESDPQHEDANLESSCDPTRIGDVTLTAGSHASGFDVLVVAMPPEVLKVVTAKFTQTRWTEMLNNSASVATQSFQLWLDVTAGDLGCNLPPDPVTTFAQPFATWADMSHLLAQETWPSNNRPMSLHYFCGPMPDPVITPMEPDPIPRAQQEAEQARKDWLDGEVGAIWPAFNDSHIVKKYVRANVDRSDLYVQVPPRSIAHRLPPGASGYHNLFLAGDWTRTRNSGGCVEVAVESGLLAARAISGDSTLGS